MPEDEINQQLHGFLKDLVVLIQEKYDESLAESKRLTEEPEVAFQDGLNMAYYDVLDLIRSQLLAFGYEATAAEIIVPELGKPADGAA